MVVTRTCYLQVRVPANDTARGQLGMKVLIADDHMAITMIASELAKQAFGEPSIRAVHGVDELFEQLDQQSVDLLVLDLTMPGPAKRIELLRALRTWESAPRILVYSTDASPCLVAAAMENGALGFVPKGAHLTSLLHGMKAVANGERYIDPGIQDGRTHPWRQLTIAERYVLTAQVAGRTVKQIAAETGRAYNTVATLRSHGMQKLGLRANEELSAYFYGNGLHFELDAPYVPAPEMPPAVAPPRPNVVELRPRNLCAADIETIDIIAMMLLGIDDGHKHMQVTARAAEDLLSEFGSAGIGASHAFRFPVWAWRQGADKGVVIDQGRFRVSITVTAVVRVSSS